MPRLTYREGEAVSLVQDQDIFLMEPERADLTITVIGTSEDDNTKHVTDIFVFKSVYRGSCYLQPIIDKSEDPNEITLGGSLKRGASKTHGQDEGENRESILVMLAYLHGLAEHRMEQLGLYKISFHGVWYAIAYNVRDQYGFTKDKPKVWFMKWYVSSMERVELNIYSARGLAFPCQLFDHAPAFARVTKWLAYNHIGHAKERPPKGFKGPRGLHIPPVEFVGPVNHARGGLKTTLHKSLYKKCSHLLRYSAANCEYWAPTVRHYFAALTKIGCFPVEDFLSYSSVAKIVARLSAFKYDYIPACTPFLHRGSDWKSVLSDTHSEVGNASTLQGHAAVQRVAKAPP